MASPAEWLPSPPSSSFSDGLLRNRLLYGAPKGLVGLKIQSLGPICMYGIENTESRAYLYVWD